MKDTRSTLNADGMLVHECITRKRFTTLEHGDLTAVNGVVVHQTDSSTAESTLRGYKTASNGAHFLIARDGTIYQTASTKKRCYHVGRRIKSKCLELDGKDCADEAAVKLLSLKWAQQLKQIDAHERKKEYPFRYPVNSDSIGIEIVGRDVDEKTYEEVSTAQNQALQWLAGELNCHFGTDKDDYFRHPQVSYKNPGEAASAKW
ncbi:MAG: N-acetylmuramoyl-L-alanine amidase [Paracoccaceae bacterium]